MSTPNDPTDDPDHLATLKLQRDIFNHPASGERLHQMLRRKHGLLFESVNCHAYALA